MAPGAAAEAGDFLFDEILEFFDAATNGAKDEELRGIAERIATAKTALNDQLAKTIAGEKTTVGQTINQPYSRPPQKTAQTDGR